MISSRLEDLGQVARHGQFGEAVHVEQAWAGGGDERRVGSRGDVRQLLQQADVLRMATEGEVADQQAEGLSAEGAVFLFVDLLEQCALVELDRLLQVVLQFVLADVQQAQLEPRAGLGVAHQLVQAAPGGFQLLQLGVVDDLVELVADQRIDLADAVVDHRHGVLVDGHALVEDLGGEFREHVAGIVLLAVVVGHAALGDDLVEQGQGLVELSPDCSAADDLGHGGFSGKRVRPAGRPGVRYRRPGPLRLPGGPL